MSNGQESNRNPDAYAVSKRDTVKGWMQGAQGEVLAAGASRFMPGGCPDAFVGCGFMVERADTNTTGWRTGLPDERAEAARVGRRPLGGVEGQGFHELGRGGVEGGDADGPAPAADSPYARCARDPDVIELLGGAANAAPGGWYGDVRGQTAVTLCNLQRHAISVWSALPESLRWEVQPAGSRRPGAPVRWSQWVTMCSFGSWSAGPRGIASHLRRHENALKGVSERDRPSVWFQLEAEAVARGETAPFKSHSRNPRHTAARTAQKWATAEHVAHAMNNAAASEWLDLRMSRGDRARVFSALTRGAYGYDTGGGLLVPWEPDAARGSLVMKAAGAVGLVLVVGGIVYALSESETVARLFA